jgi:predicted amidohydrolase
MRIATVSLDQKWEDKEANRFQCLRFLKQAAKDHADLVVFPEMTLTGFSMDVDAIAEPSDNLSTLEWFCTQAKSFGLAIVAGYVERNADGRGLNRCALVSAEGNPLCIYTKVHPFSLTKEDSFFAPGDILGTCRFNGVDVGLSICYDLRFPELFQLLSKRCHLIITIANWPASRVLHWNILLQARAIENQVFMVGVNRTGTTPEGLDHIYSSAIHDPMGAQVTPLRQEGPYAICVIDPDVVTDVRNMYAVKPDRREQWYRDQGLMIASDDRNG